LWMLTSFPFDFHLASHSKVQLLQYSFNGWQLGT
jgi:hypothetical protein